MEKLCPKCKKILPLEKFGTNKRSKDRHQTYCKECYRNITVTKYHTDPEYQKLIKKSSRNKWQECKKDAGKMQIRRLIVNKAQRRYRHLHLEKMGENKRATYALKKSGLRQIIIERANGQCELCKEPIFIGRFRSNGAFHHLNGNHFDNRLENLVLVCTKCHLHRLHTK